MSIFFFLLRYNLTALSDSLQTSDMVLLAAILYVDEALCDLGMFAFVVSYFFLEDGHHSSAIAELIFLIERLEDIHTEVQGVI